MSALQNEACIVGIGQTPFLRGTDDDCSSSLRVELQACEAAIKDAGLSNKDIDGILPFYGLSIAEDLAVNLGVRDLAYQATSHVGGAGPGASAANPRLKWKALPKSFTSFARKRNCVSSAAATASNGAMFPA